MSLDSILDVLPASNVERLEPSLGLFEGRAEHYYPALEGLMKSVLPAKSLDEKWDIGGKPGLDYATYGTEFSTLHFYQLLIRMGGYKRILELGSFIGVSTLFLAEAVGPDGHVLSVESGEEFAQLAEENVERNGRGNVRILRDDALGVLRHMGVVNWSFDLILMDAAKQLYGEMLRPALYCLAKGGLLLVDDVFMHGETLNAEPTTDKGKGVRLLLEKVKRLDWANYPRVILPLGNGLLMVYKR